MRDSLIAENIVHLRTSGRDVKGSTEYTLRSAHVQSIGHLPLDDFLNYVEGRLRCRLSINMAARLVGLSRAMFTKRFRASVGVSFHRYVICRRVELAKRMLHATELDLDSISEATGFCSQAHFATVFREMAGSTPARFRALRQ